MLSPEALKKIDREIAKYPANQKQSAVMAGLAIAQDELCLAGRGLRVIAGLRTLAACSQRRDDLAVWRECLRRQQRINQAVENVL